jgi:hypothetical protein
VELSVLVSPATNRCLLIAKHKKEALEWDFQPYARTSGTAEKVAEGDIFDEINRFWASCSPVKQQRYWELYQDLTTIISEGVSVMSIVPALTALTQQMAKLTPLSEMAAWVLANGNMTIPPDLLEEYSEKYPEGSTYLRRDYIELALLAVAFRPIVPIWTSFLSRATADSSVSDPDGLAISFLKDTDLIESPAIARMRVYINTMIASLTKKNAKVKRNGITTISVLTRVGSEELPEWLMSQLLVRRISVCPINSEDTRNNVVTNVHKFINNQVRFSAADKEGSRRFGGKITARDERDSDMDDDNLSNIEKYRMKKEVDEATIVINDYYLEDSRHLLLELDPEPDLDMYYACRDLRARVGGSEITTHHLTLLRWLIATVNSPHVVPSLSREVIADSLVTVQYVLWRRGFKNLAALCTLEMLPRDPNFVQGILQYPVEVPKELYGLLTELFPHYRRPKGALAKSRISNVVISAADLLVENIAADRWKYVLPEQLALELNVQDGQDYQMPFGLRVEIAHLHIDLAQRSRKAHA